MQASHPAVTLSYDAATEDKRVTYTFTPAEAEFVEHMHIVAFGMCQGFALRQRGESDAEMRASIKTALHVMLANPAVAKAINAMVTAAHCELHHSGQTCNEAHPGDEDWSAQ